MKAARVAAALLVSLGAQAQEATFSTDVKVVNLFATVRDKGGKVIKGLTKDDFQVLEDGKPQTIRYFSQESNLPLIVGLLVDTSRSMQVVFEPERVAANKFFQKVLRDQRDQAFILTFDNRVNVLQDLTGSHEKLAHALTLLKIPERPATLVHDGVRDGAEIMKKQSGRKAMIVLSDGMDFGSRSTLPGAIEFALRADTMVYTVYFDKFSGAGRGGRGRGGRGRGAAANPTGRDPRKEGPVVMERLAKETGGVYSKVDMGGSVDKIFARIEDELRNQYSIGYTPPEGGKEFRKLELTVKKKGAVVVTRPGYYPK